MNKAGDEAELLVYDPIDSYYGIGAKDIRKFLDTNKDVKTLNIRVNSPGGDVFEGTAMFNILKRCSAKKIGHVDGIAASMASVLLMACDEIVMADNGYMMIHNPMVGTYGDAEDMRHSAELLDKVKSSLVDAYATRANISRERIEELMDAETWLTAKEAIDIGLCDRCSGVLAIAASIEPSKFNKVPESLRAKPEGVIPMSESKPVPATLAELKNGLPGSDAAFREECLEKGLTLTDSMSAWMAKLAAANANLTKEVSDADEKMKTFVAEAEKHQVHKPGASKKPAKQSDEEVLTYDDPIGSFNALVRENMKLGNDRRKSIRLSARQNPELHEAYLAATNPASKQELVGKYITDRREALAK